MQNKSLKRILFPQPLMDKKSEVEEQHFCYSVAHFVNIIAQNIEDSQFGTSRRHKSSLKALQASALLVLVPYQNERLNSKRVGLLQSQHAHIRDVPILWYHTEPGAEKTVCEPAFRALWSSSFWLTQITFSQGWLHWLKLQPCLNHV